MSLDLPADPNTSHNLPERSVSELSNALKRTVEETFGRVRVRGEISAPKLVGSGHCYLRLKDDNAVIDAVIWKGTYSKLTVRPEEGMEVVATGRLTTYPQRSSYQLIIEGLELAGQGALLKLLEDRRKRLAAEGLFDTGRKRAIPYLPRVIGVITSPTGAVIRDILHRLADRFPMHVLVWPVLVQGDGAAEQVANAVAGFNALSPDGPVPRPDVLIVARGGGSLEDLMAFNEEAVVRAVAASLIPVISAVGHETDTTLCDFAADLRAPTPTGAAEMAVPVRLDLLAQVQGSGARLIAGTARALEDRAVRLAGLVRGLPPLDRVIEERQQRVDDRRQRLDTAIAGRLTAAAQQIARLHASLRSPREQVNAKASDLRQWQGRLAAAVAGLERLSAQRLDTLASRLRPDSLQREVARQANDLMNLGQRLETATTRGQSQREAAVLAFGERLKANSHEAILERGFALVRDGDGALVDSAGAALPGAAWSVTLKDGTAHVRVEGTPPPSLSLPPAKRKKPDTGAQSSLF